MAMICLCSALCGTSLGVAGAPVEHTPFVTVVLRNFDAWDTDHNGVISGEEIAKLVKSPEIKADDAAAVATLKLLSHGKVKLPPLTKAYFQEYDQRAMNVTRSRGSTGQPSGDAIAATVDTVASAATTQPAKRSGRLPVDFDLYFSASKERIARGGAALFTGRYSLEHARQGPLGDCFFVSGVGSLLVHDPSRLEKMITPSADGKIYTVQLAAGPAIQVPAPTDTELALSSTTAGDGAWLAILEQAFGKYRSRLKGNGEDVEGTDVIRTGGDSTQTIRALTGHKTLRLSFGKTVEYRRENADKMLPEIRKQLTLAFAEHRMITAGVLPPFKPSTEPTAGEPTAGSTREKITGTPTPVPPDISVNHVYAIVGFDPKTDVVEIWNPHGQHFIPKGPAGITNGYPTEHGIFKLPLREAYQFYTSFTFELAQPATEPAI